MPVDECMVGVPQQSDIVGVCPRQNFLQGGRVDEVAMRLEDHDDAAWTGIFGHFVHTDRHAGNDLVAGTALELVAEDAYVRSAE